MVAMNFVLVNAYDALHSYGLAIIVLSLVVNTVLLPLYHMADKWQIEEREKQQKMAKKVAEIKQAFKGQERFMMLKTLYRQNHYHPIMAVRNSVGFLIQVPFFFAAYQLLSHFPALQGQSFGIFNNLGVADALIPLGNWHINLMPFVMTAINLLSAFVYTKGLSAKDKIQLYVFAGLFLVLLYNSPVGLVLYWTLNNVYSLGKNIVTVNFSKITKSTFISSCKLPFTFIRTAYVKLVPSKIQKLIIIPEIKSPLICFSSLYIVVFLIAAYVPINVYLSDPAFFHIRLSDVVRYGIQTIVISLSCFGIIYLCLSERLKGKISFLFSFIAITCLFNVLIPLRNYGAIDSYLLTNEDAFKNLKLLNIYDLSIIISLFSLIYILTKKNIIQKIKPLFPLTAIVLSTFVIFLCIKSSDPAKEDRSIPVDITFPTYNNVLNSYSKTQKNIVVMMLDMFTGDHVADIFKTYPQLEKQFTGFTWYPDTVTAGSGTYLSEPSIHGGYKYTPQAINARSEKIDSIMDEIAKGYQVFNDNLGKQGFDISLYGTQFVDCKQISKYVEKQYLKVCEEMGAERDYFPFYMNYKNIKIDYSSVDDNQFLQAYGLMSSVPYRARKYIYKNGTWMGIVNKSFNARTYANYGYLDSLDKISNSNSSSPTFKYIQSNIPHLPWNISDELELTLLDPYPKTEGQKTKINGIIPEHFYAEAFSLQAISKWIHWLKENQIYDNTMIVLVSDHGEGDSVSLSESFGINVQGEFGQWKNKGYPSRPHGLLMVKSFNDNQPFSISSKPMYSADVSNIVCDAVGECAQTKKFKGHKNRTHSVGEWSPIRHEYNKFNLTEQYIIEGTMFNKENWKQVK